MNRGRGNRIRSLNDRNWYWVSKSILNQYGRILKSSGHAVYSVLASYANSKSQTCFPTQQAIAEKIGVCRRTVSRKVRLLKDLNLVRVRRIRGRCIYFLLSPDETNGIHQMRQKGYKVCDTGVVYNNNNKRELFNKNNADGFNNLKPLQRLLKRYDHGA